MNVACAVQVYFSGHICKIGVSLLYQQGHSPKPDIRPKSTAKVIYKACQSESGTEVGAPLFPAVELCDFPGRWQCMSGEIWYTLDSGSVLLTEAESR